MATTLQIQRVRELTDLVNKVSVGGSHGYEVVMGCGDQVGSQIRHHGACDGDESQDDSRDSSRHCREQPVWFFPADNPHCVTDSDGQDWRSVNTSVLAVNEHGL